jgi:probable rRNA maturation factor
LPSRPRLGGDGDPEVFVADEQNAVPVDTARWAALVEGVLRAEGVRGHAELSLLFVDEDDIAVLNEQFLGHDGPTDVLAFPIDATDVEVVSTPTLSRSGPDRAPIDPGDLPILLGDVVLCPAVAARQASSHAGTLDDELALLVVHGVLHVLGHDHADADQTLRMRARERELLEAHHWGGPAPESFRHEQVEP